MAQWEYCELRSFFGHYTIACYTSTGRDIVSDAPDASSIHHNIARLGIAGWELVCVDEGIYYFKRPIQSERPTDDTL